MVLKRLFDMRSKEEKEQAYQEYFSEIFPYGELQRIRVGLLLQELFPKERKKYIFLFYILLKEKYLKSGDFEAALKKVEKKKIISKYDELPSIMRKLLMHDLQVTEELHYPTKEAFGRVK